VATRRSFLALLVTGTGLAAGCGANATSPASPDEALRARTADSARQLAALYEAALSGESVDHAEATLFRGHHLAHVQRLTKSSGSSGPATAGSTTEGAAKSNPTRADLVAAERAASGASAADVKPASAELAPLLASITACRALHAQSLDPSQPSATSDAPPLGTAKSAANPSSVGLQAVLSAEYALIFAFGALGPHLTGSQCAAAHAAFDLHREQRDALMSTIAARGDSPRAAEASYELPFRVTDAASARRLAALVETRLTAVCAQAVSVASGADRTYAAWALTQAALRARTWGAPVTAFPGLDT
jgi:hypothetical protein